MNFDPRLPSCISCIVTVKTVNTHFLLFSFCFRFQKASTTVNVHVVDENDNAPEFPEEEYVTVLSEGPETVGATIATVTAIDPDEGPNGTLRYAIARGNLVQTFNIDSVTVRRGSGGGGGPGGTGWTRK